MTPATTMDWSLKQITDWREAWKQKNVVHNGGRTTIDNHTQKWSAPAKRSLKLNIDASVFEGKAEIYRHGA